MKRIFIILVTSMILVTLTACQITPDEGFVVENDTERMLELASKVSAETKVTELEKKNNNYTFKTSAADGKLTISVDAPVTIPESDKIPTARVSETGLTQEQVTGFFKYLFPDEKPVTGDNEPGVLTKDKIRGLIDMYRGFIAEGTAEEKTLYTLEELEHEIENLEKQYETAPETEPKLDIHVSDGTMSLETTGGDRYAGEEVLVLDAGAENKRFFVSSPVDNNAGTENYLGFHVNNRSFSGSLSDMNAVRIDEANLENAVESNLNITFEEAMTLCNGFFEAGKITDVTLSDAFIIEDTGAYQFNYVRTVGDIPVANMSYLGSDGDGDALPWTYERIIFLVSNDGIVDIEWSSHSVTGEIISEDTGVIDFEEAREIFETMIVATYGATDDWQPGLSGVSIDINDIELSLVRVREQNDPGRNGIYTPAWVFYGNIKKSIKTMIL